jgi:hypothetical protein
MDNKYTSYLGRGGTGLIWLKMVSTSEHLLAR